MILIMTALVLIAPPAEAPGAVQTTDKAQVCSAQWVRSARHVTPATKRRIYARDHKRPSRRCCEIDHRVPLELGGANVEANLWAEPWRDAHQKDKLENRLHRAVCRGDISLKMAQAFFLEHYWERQVSDTAARDEVLTLMNVTNSSWSPAELAKELQLPMQQCLRVCDQLIAEGRLR